MSNVRKIVLKALLKLEKDDGYSNIIIDNAIQTAGLEGRDANFAAALFYGVLERKLTLDYIIQTYSKQGSTKIKPIVLQVLRLGLYQLLYMDKVPDSAAVNESVRLIKAMGLSSLSGYVNAVLRAFLRDGKQIKYPDDPVERLTVEFSCPRPIVDSFIADYGLPLAKTILSGFTKQRGVTIRVNTVKIEQKAFEDMLNAAGVAFEKSEICEHALLLKQQGSVEKLCGFEKGYFHVQDLSSQLCAKALGAKPGDRVLDVCAAPGGKSFTIAENMQNNGEVLALDKYPQKVEMIQKSAKRLGLSCVKADVNDAGFFNSNLGSFNKVLCDLPCSGLGILGKKPEIRYKNVAFLDKLPVLQYDLLDKSAQYLENGGVLVYSTCTLRQAENREIADRFLQEHNDFEPFPVLPGVKRCVDEPEHILTLFPGIHNTDGFFISAFQKKG